MAAPCQVQPKLKGVIKLGPGVKVKVVGLQNNQDLNGQVGTLLQFDATKMRWGVELQGGKKISLKMTNLTPLDTQVSDATLDTATGAPKPTDASESVEDQTSTGAGYSSEASAKLNLGSEGPRLVPGDDTESWPVLPTSDAVSAKIKSGCWFDGGSAAKRFTKQLQENDPKLVSVVLVPPKRFNEEDVIEICDALEVNTVCQELIASGHSLSEESCKRLGAMLPKTTSLQLLSVGDSSLADKASLVFAELAKNTSVTSLDLEQKGLTPSAGHALAIALEARGLKHVPRLAALRLSGNKGIAGALEELSRIAPAPLLLTLCDCALNTAHAKALGCWVSKGVRDLDLRDNSSLGGEGIEAFTQSLVRQHEDSPLPLSRLGLNGCAIGDDGLEAIALVCRKGLELEELLLERCEITSEGCHHLADALARRKLRKLSARANVIGDEGCMVLAECARCLDLSATSLSGQVLACLGKHQLESLELFSNPALGPSVASWCSEIQVTEWQKLEYLDLSGCALRDEGFQCICTRLTETPELLPALCSLCLGGNDVSDSEACLQLAEQLGAARGGRLRVIWRDA